MVDAGPTQHGLQGAAARGQNAAYERIQRLPTLETESDRCSPSLGADRSESCPGRRTAEQAPYPS